MTGMAVVTYRYMLPPDPDRSEILRYAGYYRTAGEQGVDASLMEECLKKVLGTASYRVCYRIGSLETVGDLVKFDFAETHSKNLAKALAGCRKAVVFAATAGSGIDRLIRREERVSPAKALWYQAIGAERVESLCDAFCSGLSAEFAGRGLRLRPRFSPGYGDLSMEFQKDLFRVLVPGKIGITLSESLLMSPSKSVTAVIGVEQIGKQSET